MGTRDNDIYRGWEREIYLTTEARRTRRKEVKEEFYEALEIINSQFSKKELRRILLQKRQSMPLLEWREKSDRLTTNIQNSVIFNQANTILSFFSFRQEPDISSLYTNTNKRWGFPRCVDKSLVWHFWQPNDTINIGAYG
ncbi:MAG: 5-formyltetrahydrofolate cyclo-ligase, partial [Aphanizomenon sp.]